MSIDEIPLDDDDNDDAMNNETGVKRGNDNDEIGKYALIFFTSGTTGAPKGVPWTHDMLAYQLSTLSMAWKWTRHDHIVNVLPLHHIHGLVNIVLSALYNSASLEMHSAFDAHSVWSSFTRPSSSPLSSTMSSSSRRAPPRPTLFMAVPSIYQRLIHRYHDHVVTSDRDRRHMKDATSAMRLFVCGSAALSRTDFDKWLDISGHAILERYGMTETGMTLSNAYHNRQRGYLGAALPGVETRVDVNGQLLVKGRGVFNGYWKDQERTRGAFTKDGFFETGDIVEYVEEIGYYRLLGRANADFVKSGGYRVSTLEVEDVIREAPGARDCTVIGIPDQHLGERIVVAIIPKESNVDDADKQERLLDGIKVHAMERLPKYKVPRDFLIVDDLPRNVLGKVQKQMLRAQLRHNASYSCK